MSKSQLQNYQTELRALRRQMAENSARLRALAPGDTSAITSALIIDRELKKMEIELCKKVGLLPQDFTLN